LRNWKSATGAVCPQWSPHSCGSRAN